MSEAPAAVRIKQRVEWLVLRLALASLERAPMSVADALARLYIRPVYWFARGARRIALRNLEIAGLPDRERILRGVFDSIARLVATFARFPRMTRDDVAAIVRCEGLENLRTVRSRGHGVLIATAHLGNWELGAFAHALLDEPMHIVVRPLDNPLIGKLVERYRSASGNRVVAKSGAARQILRALGGGATVAMLIEHNMAAHEGVFVDFFGVKACSDTAPARLARLSGAGVLLAYAVWSAAERRYIIRFEPEIVMTGYTAADTQRIQSRLESAIRKYPDQWLWTQKRWKTRPPGGQC